MICVPTKMLVEYFDQTAWCSVTCGMREREEKQFYLQ
jgi:hypothetical protein